MLAISEGRGRECRPREFPPLCSAHPHTYHSWLTTRFMTTAWIYLQTAAIMSSTYHKAVPYQYTQTGSTLTLPSHETQLSSNPSPEIARS